MEKPALPEYEEQRLKALRYLGILDTPPDEGFDRLTRVIKSQFDVPIVLVSLIDDHRQWVKSKQGTDISEISREYSMCAHAILGDDLFYVSDAREDPRFVDNPFVIGEPFVRFYTAIPLSVDGGLKVGTLSIIDTKPRKLTSDQIASFRDFGDCVEQQLVQSRLQDNANFLVSQTSRLNTLLETIADGIVTIDSASNVESLNTQAAHLFGYEPYEILGKNFNQLMPDLGRGGWDGYTSILFGDGCIDGVDAEQIKQVMGLRKDGTLFPMDLSVRVMYLEGKRLYTGIIRDVTDRKAVDDELKRGQQLLEVMKENVPVGISVFDENKKLVVVNQEALALFRLPEELAQLGTTYPTIIRYFAERGDFGEGDVDDIVKDRVRIGHSPERQRFLRSIIDGNRTVEVNTRPMPGGGVVSLYLDITERLRSEEKLEKLLFQANAANQAKTDFLSTISHEIRTPLNGVIGMAQMLGHTDMNSEQQEKLDIILKSGNTLLELINDVLDMSKIEAGNLEIEYIPCDLRDVVTSVKAPFEVTTKNKGVEFRTFVDPKIAAHHISDPTRLHQIIMNLLSNALKFTDMGSVELAVRLREELDDNIQYVGISVEDTGVGVPEDRLSSIFDSFSQADSSVTRKFGGTGLGLSIVKNLVTLMGGTITLSSEIGKGSCFEIILPIAVASKKEAETLATGSLVSEDQSTVSLKVLVAEDNDVNVLITAAFLKKIGHDCQIAENGVEALRMFEDGNFDLILMDIHMPEMDGIEATRKLREREDGQFIPIIGLTADAFKERHAHFIEVGMDDVLTKPFTEEQLVEVMSKNRTRQNIKAGGVLVENEPNDHDVKASDFLGIATSEPIGSDEKYQEFKDQLGPEVTRTLIKKTPDAILKELGSLRDGLQKKDSEIVLRAAHTISGVAGSMCADRLAKQASIIEQSSGNLTEILATLPEIERTVEDTIVWWSSKAQEELN